MVDDDLGTSLTPTSTPAAEAKAKAKTTATPDVDEKQVASFGSGSVGKAGRRRKTECLVTPTISTAYELPFVLKNTYLVLAFSLSHP